MFEIGSKVVCVNGSFPAGIHDIFNALPAKGTTYTVRDIVPAQGFNLKETAGVYLTELVNRPNRHGIEPGFQCERFREVEVSEIVEYAGQKLVIRKELQEWTANGMRVINDRSEAAPGSYVVEVDWVIG